MGQSAQSVTPTFEVVPPAQKGKFEVTAPTGKTASPSPVELDDEAKQLAETGGGPAAVYMNPKDTAIAVGAMAAPELLPEGAGGTGLLAFLARAFGRAGLSAIGAGSGKMATEAVGGENPFSKENLAETGKLAAFTTAIGTPLEFLAGLPFTKTGRSAINQSLGAQTRDITYGNPAKGLVDEGISDISTGDYEAYKAALRSGKTPQEAALAAGGRFAAVSQRLSELGPKLENALQNSSAQIPVKHVISDPLDIAMMDVINNGAMTDAEKLTAFTQLDELKKSMLQKVPGPTASPTELQELKQQIGNRINWQGTIGVTDEVKPAYRNVYASIKEAINRSVPESAGLNERMTNLLSAFSDLDNLARAEEVGRGAGVMRGKMGLDIAGMIQGGAGKFLPGMVNLNAGTPMGATIGQQLLAKGKGIPQAAPNEPGVPFHPNERSQ